MNVSIGNNNSIVPEKLTLFQNYPNPFNPSTTISYKISNSGLVILKIYDLKGKEISTLSEGIKNIGEYHIIFDAQKYNLSSGIYLYQVTSLGKSVTKKMILIK